MSAGGGSAYRDSRASVGGHSPRVDAHLGAPLSHTATPGPSRKDRPGSGARMVRQSTELTSEVAPTPTPSKNVSSSAPTYSHDPALLKPIVKTARKLVSRDKVRMNVHGFDLDLTYIIDGRLIAMGIPGTKADKAWRNNADEVADFFRKFHAGQFLFYNLSGLSYDYSLFDNRVVEVGWPDHHAPPLELLHAIVTAMHNFYRADPKNCLAVHCLAGRGRTGTVICCFLLYANMQPDPASAVAYFSQKRSGGGKDLTGPSQLRYIHYYYRFLHRNLPLSFVSLRLPQKLRLDAIEMSPVPRFHARKRCTPYVKCFRLDDPSNPLVVFPHKSALVSFEATSSQPIVIPFPRDCVVAGDVQIKVFHRCPDLTSFTALTTSGDFSSKRESVSFKYPNVLMFRLSVHSDFHTEIDPTRGRHVITLTKDQLDCMFAGPLRSDRFDPGFTVRIFYTLVPSSDPTPPKIAPLRFNTPTALQTPSVPAVCNARPLKPTDRTDVPPHKRRLPPNYAWLEPSLIHGPQSDGPSAAETLRRALLAVSEAPTPTESRTSEQHTTTSSSSLPSSSSSSSSSSSIPSSLSPASVRHTVSPPASSLSPTTARHAISSSLSPSPSSSSSSSSLASGYLFPTTESVVSPTVPRSISPPVYPSAFGGALPPSSEQGQAVQARPMRRSWGAEQSAAAFFDNRPALGLPVSTTVLTPTPYATAFLSPRVATSPVAAVPPPSTLLPTPSYPAAPLPATTTTTTTTTTTFLPPNSFYPYPTSGVAPTVFSPALGRQPTAADLLWGAQSYPHPHLGNATP